MATAPGWGKAAGSDKGKGHGQAAGNGGGRVEGEAAGHGKGKGQAAGMAKGKARLQRMKGQAAGDGQGKGQAAGDGKGEGQGQAASSSGACQGFLRRFVEIFIHKTWRLPHLHMLGLASIFVSQIPPNIPRMHAFCSKHNIGKYVHIAHHAAAIEEQP